MASAPKQPVIIVGAGVVGLALAQGLKKEGIPFIVFDRDEHIDACGHGWAITLWALEALGHCLPARLLARLEEIEIDPTDDRKQGGTFTMYNLKTAEPTMKVTLSHQRRIDREKLRKLLCDGIDVQWNKTLKDFTETDKGMLVSFEDGTSVLGSLVVGVDGAQSKVRQQLCPTTHELHQLPIRFLGTTIKMSPEEAKVFTELDKLMFQATHPDTGTFFWYALLGAPAVNGSDNTSDPHYRCQLNISWPVKTPDDEIPATNAGRVRKIKLLAEVFEARFKKPVMDIPEDLNIVEIKFRKWPVLPWPTLGGKITLAGDAAHAMTMYRGEAANHGITDANVLKDNLVKMWASEGGISQDEALQSYEANMRPRTLWSVNASRQAWLDSHDHEKSNVGSGLVSVQEANKVAVPISVG
ncbi:unnamed protein product [Clonostachys rhizophaga]|uniref:FAD-binding domain-containing protein n=1 Tax=Clonostachys rhizophaga TaxID=160324 RepID=A0A9N9VYQ6_9HYPO|nr:unnamed protein product [Clonostachys rhizophaga]